MNDGLLPLLKDLSELFENRMKFHYARNIYGLSQDEINRCRIDKDKDKNYLDRINAIIKKMEKSAESQINQAKIMQYAKAMNNDWTITKTEPDYETRLRDEIALKIFMDMFAGPDSLANATVPELTRYAYKYADEFLTERKKHPCC